MPRALVTADPYFRALARLGPVQALLAARRALLGDGSVMSEGRFVYENVGQTLLMSWQAAGACGLCFKVFRLVLFIFKPNTWTNRCATGAVQSTC